MAQGAMDGASDSGKRRALDTFPDTIGRMGNAVPRPAIIFAVLIALVIALSMLLSALGASVTHDRLDPVTHEFAEVTTQVRSLLSADGIPFMVTSPLANFMGSGAVAKWAIFAPIFMPLFMRLGGGPDLVLAASRVGDSPANAITPPNVHLGVTIGFLPKHVKDAGIGTIVAPMLPCALVMLVLWTLLLIGRNAFGLPPGPA